MRADAAKREPGILERARPGRLYCEQLSGDASRPMFTLHDGPPYANGPLHVGHALNKCLKDFINRYKILRGYRVHFRPGWDTHGLPIELKAAASKEFARLRKSLKAQGEEVTPAVLREQCANVATAAIADQRAGFERWGVLGDWERPYTTMDPEYEAAQLGVFQALFERGLVWRALMPVHWSPSTRTALAEAELEYVDDYESRAVYCAFDVVGSGTDGGVLPSPCRLAVWTTTPWTLPANEAVAVHPDMQYCVVEGESGQPCVLVAVDRLDALRACHPHWPLRVLGDAFTGAELLAGQYQYAHPFDGERTCPIIESPHVTGESGTGLVHSAPAHGHDDFVVCERAGVVSNERPLTCMVDDAGRYTSAAPEGLAGLSVLGDAVDAVIERLRSSGVLLSEAAFQHRYPHDWRTKKPVIFRATWQWFASVGALRARAMECIEKEVEFVPPGGRQRLLGMLGTRDHWCISRQRAWGVPLPVFYERATGEALLTHETVAHVREVVAAHGSQAWWQFDVAELLPERLRGEAHRYEKGKDTMDVWFDSGSSWAAVLPDGKADVYVEGSDQHRGWFQSSLLTSVAAQDAAPYRRVVTHGFVLDESGQKMSKSKGNVVDPSDVVGGSQRLGIAALGADGLRAWVASVDYSRDAHIGSSVLDGASRSLVKLRNTLRFLLGAVHDLPPPTSEVDVVVDELIDRVMMHRLSEVHTAVEAHCDAFNFHGAFAALVAFATTDVSALYVDVVKDRLYCDAADSARRRSAQRVLQHVLDFMTLALAPIVPFTAEDVHQHSGVYDAEQCYTVMQRRWQPAAEVRARWQLPAAELRAWERISSVRQEVYRQLESMRARKEIGKSLEAVVRLTCARHDDELLPYTEQLASIFIVSRVDVEVGGDEDMVEVRRADKGRCERCWQFTVEEGADEICKRCALVVQE